MTFDRVQESDIKGDSRPEKSTPGKPKASMQEPQPPTQDDAKPTSVNEAQEKSGSMAQPSTQEQPEPASTGQQDSKEQHENEPSTRLPDGEKQHELESD